MIITITFWFLHSRKLRKFECQAQITSVQRKLNKTYNDSSIKGKTGHGRSDYSTLLKVDYFHLLFIKLPLSVECGFPNFTSANGDSFAFRFISQLHSQSKIAAVAHVRTHVWPSILAGAPLHDYKARIIEELKWGFCSESWMRVAVMCHNHFLWKQSQLIAPVLSQSEKKQNACSCRSRLTS